MAKKDQANKKFETALEELESVVEQLESGDLSLEDSLAVFEKGVGLVKYCNQKLSEVEKKVELLIKDKEGRLQLKLLDSLADQEEKDEGRLTEGSCYCPTLWCDPLFMVDRLLTIQRVPLRAAPYN
jgi:exodeoxyribonuclease VII small subunit